MKRDGRTITVVQKPADIPQDVGVRYVRLLSDPTLLQHGRTGQLFALRNGNAWPHDGYVWEANAAGHKSLRPASLAAS